MRSHGAFHRRAASKPTMCAPMLSQRNGAILQESCQKIREKLKQQKCQKLWKTKTVAELHQARTKQRPCARFMQSRGDAPSDIERTGSAAIKAQSVLFGRVNSSPWTSKVRVLRVCLVCSYE